MIIAGQKWSPIGAYEWTFRRFKAAPFMLFPSPYIYGLGKQPTSPSDYDDPGRPWDFGIQWGFWGVTFGFHWMGDYKAEKVR